MSTYAAFCRMVNKGRWRRLAEVADELVRSAGDGANASHLTRCGLRA